MKFELELDVKFDQKAESVQNEDANAYLERLTSTPCGSDGLTFSSKSNNSSAKSLSHAGKMLAMSLVKSENDLRKAEAFDQRYPGKGELVGKDREVDELYKEFKDYTRTNEVREVTKFINECRSFDSQVRDRVAKHVAQIGGYNGILTNETATVFAKFAFNYWVNKNPELRAEIMLGLEA